MIDKKEEGVEVEEEEEKEEEEISIKTTIFRADMEDLLEARNKCRDICEQISVPFCSPLTVYHSLIRQKKVE